MKKMTDDRVDAELDRIEAEAGCELPDLIEVPVPDGAVSGSARHRAARLLACDDPPRGEDLDLCARLVEGAAFPDKDE